MTMDEFNESVERCVKGDGPLYPVVVGLYGLVDAVVKKGGHRWDEDIRQDVVIKLLMYLDKWDGRKTPWNYFWLVASCRVRDAHAKNATYNRRFPLTVDVE